jgi:EmrB/QacA subfamily drug resistance transporter
MQAVLEETKASAPYRYRWVALFVILAAEVMDLLDSLVTTIAGPSIRTDLGGSYALIQWLGAAYTLAMAIGLLTGGRLGDIFGRQRMFLVGAIGFTLASLACALSQAPGELIAARTVQGLFGAIMLPQGLGMIRQMFTDPKEMAKAFGAFGPVMGLGAVAGPILAGWLVDADYFGSGWRMIFFINVPLGIFAVVGALRFLPDSRLPRPPRLDLVGVLFAAAGAFLLLFPLVQGRELDWPVWCFVMLAAGVVVFGVFSFFESRRERNGLDPLVTPSLFRKRAFTGGLALGMVFFGALIGTGLIFTFYLQIGLGYSPLKAGLSTLPQALGTIAGFGAAAGLTEKLGRRLLQIGTLIMLVATAGFAYTVWLAGAGINPYQMIPSLLFLGIGMGMAMAPFFNIVLAGVDDQETGSASGALTSVQQLGGAFGIAVLGTFFFALLPGAVTHHVDGSANELRTVLTATGVPAPAQPAVTAGLRACLADRVSENDPDVVPASCRGAGSAQNQDPRIGAYVTEQVQGGFRDTTIRTTAVTVLLLLLAIALSFFLPRRARPEDGH